MIMKFEYDKDVDAGYIYLEDSIEEGGVKKTIELNENIIIDFDENGKLIGIEILNASQVMKEKSLVESQTS